MEPALCHGIILSDHLIREAGTGKLSLIGCFNLYNLSQFPAQVPPFFITALLTNLRGKFQKLSVTVRIEDPATGHVLVSSSATMELKEDANPLSDNDVVELPFPIRPIILPKAGMYSIVVLVDNEKIGHRPLKVNSITSSQTPQIEG